MSSARKPDYPGEVIDPKETARLAKLFEGRTVESALRELGIAPSPAPGETPAELVCAQAYQVVGSLLSDLGQFETDRAAKILDNLSEARVVHDDVLPWPSFAAPAVGAEAGDWRNYWADEMQKKADNDKARGCLQPVGYYVRSAFIYAGVGSKS